MEKLYDLTFYTRPNGDYREGFFIGLFAGRQEAVEVEARYRREVPGFKDYDCEAEIRDVAVIGGRDGIREVYRYTGWNVNADFDEVDIILSDCYASREQAEADYENAKRLAPRQEWALNRYVIGRCHWKDGFVRMYS